MLRAIVAELARAGAFLSYNGRGFDLPRLRNRLRMHRMDDAILFSSCFDANGGIFEVLLGAEDAVISDSLNHASIIDGVRLCKAQRFRYANNDMHDLETQLKAAAAARFRLVVTDGVLPPDRRDAALDMIGALETLPDTRTLMDQLRVD